MRGSPAGGIRCAFAAGMRSRDRTGAFLRAALVAALTCVGACGREETRVAFPAPHAGGGADGPVPGVVVFCLDTLRADALRVHGGRGLVPSIDAFAADAMTFLDASASAPWTAPSLATLLTGLEPAHHGVVGPLPSAPPLAASVRTLAQILAAAGWHAAAFTAGAWASPGQGIERGFDVFDTSFDVAGPESCLALWANRRPKDRPFFLFLHTYAAHDPYGDKSDPDRAPGPEVADYAAGVGRLLEEADRRGGRFPAGAARLVARSYMTDPPARAAVSRAFRPERLIRLWEPLSAWLDGGYRSDADAPEVEARLRASYEAGLSWADAVFSRTMEALRRHDVPEGTAIVVVSDHGEAFGEHGTLGHGAHLHDELTRVAILLRAPGRAARGTVRGSCGLVDVAATVLDLAGLAAPAASDGDGRSLVPIATGVEDGWPVVARAWRRRPGPSPGPPLEITSVRTDRAKYVRSRDPATRRAEESIYDLLDDPGERDPLPVRATDRFGAEFCAAVGSVRREGTLPSRADAARDGTAPATATAAPPCEGAPR